jgi:ribulose-phosphate 3-epimerase
MSTHYWICPSILSADFARLGEEVDRVLGVGADRIHIDVMDNHYVPNLTFGPLVCKALRKYGVKAPLDVHLMVEPVDDLISQFIDVGVNCIVFHPEASRHVDRSLQKIKQAGVEAGLAINPAATLSSLTHVWDKIDRILLMSVNPGFGGQVFIPETLKKAKMARAMIDQHNPKIRLEIDGGVHAGNIAEIAQAGVDTFVAGSAIFGQLDYAQVIQDMRAALLTANVKP